MAHLSSSEIYMAAMGQFFKDLGDHRWLSRYLVLTLKLLIKSKLKPRYAIQVFFYIHMGLSENRAYSQ